MAKLHGGKSGKSGTDTEIRAILVCYLLQDAIPIMKGISGKETDF